MDITKIDDRVSVTGQVWPEDMAEIAGAGFKLVICNRPDNEAANQPSFEQIREAAKANGLAAVYIPIVPGLAGATEVRAFADALTMSAGPVLAFCRSGARSNAIYSACRG